MITTVLKRYLNAEPLAYHGGGQAPKLSHTEALVVADCVERGTGQEQAAYIIGKRRAAKGIYKKDGEAEVSRKAVQTALKVRSSLALCLDVCPSALCVCAHVAACRAPVW